MPKVKTEKKSRKASSELSQAGKYRTIQIVYKHLLL